MQVVSQQKSFQTSLAIVPPVALWPQIQKIRKFYDSAYARWMPHINICFPFVQEADFEPAHQLLQNAFKDFPAFEVNLQTLGFFTFEKDCVLWAEPETEEPEAFTKLIQVILKELPQCDDLAKKGKDGFKPHMTLGRFEEKLIQKKLNQYQANWQTLSFKVDELYLISRKDGESPFYVQKTIKLNAAKESTAMKEINGEMKEFEREFYITNCF